jgi:hypothetical protein
MYGSSHSHSMNLTLILRVDRTEDDDGWVDLLGVYAVEDEAPPAKDPDVDPLDGLFDRVEAQEVPDAEDSATRCVNWLRETWNCVGADMLWDHHEHPPDGLYRVTGRLHGWWSSGPDGDDYDEEFEIGAQVALITVELLAAELERACAHLR